MAFYGSTASPCRSIWLILELDRAFDVGLFESAVGAAEGDGPGIEEKHAELQLAADFDWEPDILVDALVGDFSADLFDVCSERDRDSYRDFPDPGRCYQDRLVLVTLDERLARPVIFL